MSGSGTQQDPWVLKTPPGTSEYRMWRDEEADPPTLVCEVGSTKLGYQLRCIEDLHAMLKERGDWSSSGARTSRSRPRGTVEAWGRSPENPVGGWYGVKKVCADASGCTCRRSSRNWARQSSNTTRGTTGCARSEASRREPVGRRIEGSMGRITAAAAIGLFVLAGIMATVGFVRDARMNVLRPRRSA